MKIIRTRDVKTPLERESAFTGRAFGQNFNNEPVPEGGIYVNNVMLEPGARTWWHSHDFGQVIQVTAGLGLIANDKGESALLQPGDLVVVPAGEWHWHGAAPNQFLLHLTVNPGNSSSTVYRGDAVSDQDYAATAAKWAGHD